MKAKYILSGRGLALWNNNSGKGYSTGLAIALTCLILCLGLLSAASALGAIPTVAQTLPPTATAMPVTTEEMRLTEEDNGSRFELSQGQALVISLEGNPSTGYMWEIAEIDEQVLCQVGEIEFEPRSNLLGAPGKQILRFEAVGEGQAPSSWSIAAPGKGAWNQLRSSPSRWLDVQPVLERLARNLTKNFVMYIMLVTGSKIYE